MTTKRLSLAIVLFCLVMTSYAEVCVGQGRSKNLASQGQRIKIYFYHDPGEYIDLSPVTRVIRTSAPARSALRALLAGPTAGEKKQGFDSLVDPSKFSIASLSIRNGVARVNFITRRWLGWAGDLGAVRFKKAVELTLKQFSNVTSVIVSLNGDANFDADG